MELSIEADLVSTDRCKESRKLLITAISHHRNPLCFLHKQQTNTHTHTHTHTSCVSRYTYTHTSTSRVLPMSRMDLTPPHTTATGVRPSSNTSALTSNAAESKRARVLRADKAYDNN